MMKIKNLGVSVKGKNILKGINMELEKGKIYFLMGPNGSGKSTLANALMGNPKYSFDSGNIFFDGKDIAKDQVDKRAKKGLFVSFQNPSEISGVAFLSFLRNAFNSLNRKKISLLEFQNLVNEKASNLNLDKKFLSRYLNDNFSGGEKKKSEILQMLILNPSVAILDEPDSGLDSDSIKIVSEEIKKFSGKDKTILIITHYTRLLKHLNPDRVFVMLDGEIVSQGEKDIIEKIENKGYGWVKNAN